VEKEEKIKVDERMTGDRKSTGENLVGRGIKRTRSAAGEEKGELEGEGKRVENSLIRGVRDHQAITKKICTSEKRANRLRKRGTGAIKSRGEGKGSITSVVALPSKSGDRTITVKKGEERLLRRLGVPEFRGKGGQVAKAKAQGNQKKGKSWDDR